MKELLEKMLIKQDELNSAIDKDWKKKRRDWRLAVFVEAAEMIDHTNWRWWKYQPTNWRQVMLELVDIWHFILSEMAESSALTYSDTVVELIKRAYKHEVGGDRQLMGCFDAFRTAVSVPSKPLLIYPFFRMCSAAGMSFEDVYKLYMGKNVLNTFRLNNGYKTGDYIKDWDGREDNDVMMDLLDCIDEDGLDDIEPLLTCSLGAYYEAIK